MIKTQYPYVDDKGIEHTAFVKTWTDDETKILLQIETGAMYGEAIDLYPCQFTYKEVNKPTEEDEEHTEENMSN